MKHRPIDMLFIDGGHDAATVTSDLESWLPLVRDGGLVCGHDRDWPGVAKVLSEIPHERGPGSIWSFRNGDAS